jgi:Icc-related predicted phosphoesterase
MRVYAISDLHTDFRENWLVLEGLSDVDYRQDTLIVAGDIAAQLQVIKDTLALLKTKFQNVCYTPGNHELWVRNENINSLQKFHAVLALCDSLGVLTRPAKLAGYWIVPLFSWYQASFAAADSDDDDTNELEGWADYHFCKWPAGLGALHDFFLGLNEAHIKDYDQPVISFSHFLPRRELLPAREHLKFKQLPQVAGSLALDEQIRHLKSSVHVFGHSHISYDRVIAGVRYVQNSLRYPRERASTHFPIKLL